jgi:hypothetical protein
MINNTLVDSSFWLPPIHLSPTLSGLIFPANPPIKFKIRQDGNDSILFSYFVSSSNMIGIGWDIGFPMFFTIQSSHKKDKEQKARQPQNANQLYDRDILLFKRRSCVHSFPAPEITWKFQTGQVGLSQTLLTPSILGLSLEAGAKGRGSYGLHTSPCNSWQSPTLAPKDYHRPNGLSF